MLSTMAETSTTTTEPGAQIFFHSNICDAKSRLAISSGVLPVGAVEATDRRYVPSAFVPNLPWRMPSSADLQTLTGDPGTNRPWDMGTDVALIKIPHDYIEPFVAMLEDQGIRAQCRRADYTTASRNPAWEANLGRLHVYVTSLAQRDVTDAIYFRVADAGLRTVTKDEFGADSGRFAGLHADSWDRLPLRFRHRARNRLCINLGRDPRYLLFINLPLIRMFQSLGLRDPEDIRSDYRGLYVGHRFMKARPDYPVIRLQIAPGEAYIMPTDNLIHDASTEGACFPDITLTFLGYFAPCNARG